MIKYEITKQATESGFNYIRITGGKFEDIIFSYGKVTIEENEDKTNAKLIFDYTIQIGSISEDEKDEFGQYTGEILLDLIDQQLHTNSVVYAGGTD